MSVENSWDYLLRRISEGRCTPFIGPGANSDLMPSGKYLAQFLAKQYEYPLGDYYDLPLVTQYISVMVGDDKLRHSLSTQLAEWADSAELERQSPRAGIYEVMSRLPLPLYITTNFDGLMEKALLHSGKKADWRVCAWNRRLRRMAPSSELSPRADSPMVFHLHGHLNMPESLVLTEDDYADFISSTSPDALMLPTRVQGAIADSMLLFVGYSPGDWSFRIILRLLLRFLQRNRSQFHYAIFLSPGAKSEPSNWEHEARRFLTEYCKSYNVSIYWGTIEEFASELKQRWEVFRHDY